MKIETKFDVNNLVQRKFDKSSENQLQAMEVMEIKSDSCYAGTQVFYYCKHIICQKEFKNKYSKEGEFTWVIAHGMSNDDFQTGWKKYREDELIEAPKEVIDVILGNN